MTQSKSINVACPSNNKRWTAKDDQILRQMLRDRATTAQVAIVLGRTKSSIWGRKSFLELDGRLSSSKGKGISAPRTVGTKNRRKTSSAAPAPVLKKAPVKAATPNYIPAEMQGLSLESISKMAKETGAKIVITFE